MHLLTREALAGYLTRLGHGGDHARKLHVSNRHMELASVVATVAEAEGLVAYVKRDGQANDFMKDYRANADVMVLAKSVADLGDLPQRPGWHPIQSTSGIDAWTDDYSDVLRAILQKKLGF